MASLVSQVGVNKNDDLIESAFVIVEDTEAYALKRCRSRKQTFQ